MALTPTKIDEAQVAAAIAKQYATAAEQQAFASELDASQTGASDDQKAAAKKNRARADALKAAGGLKDAEITEQRKAFLDDYITRLEGEYVAHKQKASMKEAAGNDPDTTDELDGVSIAQHKQAMKAIEGAHKTALAERKKLV